MAPQISDPKTATAAATAARQPQNGQKHTAAAAMKPVAKRPCMERPPANDANRSCQVAGAHPTGSLPAAALHHLRHSGHSSSRALPARLAAGRPDAPAQAAATIQGGAFGDGKAVEPAAALIVPPALLPPATVPNTAERGVGGGGEQQLGAPRCGAGFEASARVGLDAGVGVKEEEPKQEHHRELNWTASDELRAQLAASNALCAQMQDVLQLVTATADTTAAQHDVLADQLAVTLARTARAEEEVVELRQQLEAEQQAGARAAADVAAAREACRVLEAQLAERKAVEQQLRQQVEEERAAKALEEEAATGAATAVGDMRKRLAAARKELEEVKAASKHSYEEKLAHVTRLKRERDEQRSAASAAQADAQQARAEAAAATAQLAAEQARMAGMIHTLHMCLQPASLSAAVAAATTAGAGAAVRGGATCTSCAAEAAVALAAELTGAPVPTACTTPLQQLAPDAARVQELELLCQRAEEEAEHECARADQLEAEVMRKEEVIGRREQEMAALQELLRSKDVALEEREGQLRSKDVELGRMREQLCAKGLEVLAMQEQLHAKEMQIWLKDQGIRDRDEHISRQAHELLVLKNPDGMQGMQHQQQSRARIPKPAGMQKPVGVQKPARVSRPAHTRRPQRGQDGGYRGRYLSAMQHELTRTRVAQRPMLYHRQS